MTMQRNLQGKLVMAALHQKAYETGSPINATFELTPRCGFDCRMCYVHLSQERIPEVGLGRELSAEEWLEIGRQAAEMGVLSLCITGGDPILHPEFDEIWQGLARMGFLLTLQTNAAFLSERTLSLLEDYPPELVKITLYGSNDNIYREVCRKEAGFTRTDRGIRDLQERDIPIQLVTTFIRQNQADAERIAAYAKERNLPWYHSSSCYPSLRGAKSEAAECAIPMWGCASASETAELWHKLKPMEDGTAPCTLCSGYRTEFNIRWDGTLGFCLFLDEPKIPVVGESLEACWQILLQYWENLRWPKECETCEERKICRRCLAHLACLSGGLGKINPEYCRQVRKGLDEYKKMS